MPRGCDFTCAFLGGEFQGGLTWESIRSIEERTRPLFMEWNNQKQVEANISRAHKLDFRVCKHLDSSSYFRFLWPKLSSSIYLCVGRDLQLLVRGKDGIALQMLRSRKKRERSLIYVFKMSFFPGASGFWQKLSKKRMDERTKGAILILQCGSYSCVLPLPNQELQPHLEKFSFTKCGWCDHPPFKGREAAKLDLRNCVILLLPLGILLRRHFRLPKQDTGMWYLNNLHEMTVPKVISILTGTEFCWSKTWRIFSCMLAVW